MQQRTISINNFACLLGVSRATVDAWIRSGKYRACDDGAGGKFFRLQDVASVPEISAMLNTDRDNELRVTPLLDFTSVELFAGGGGLALGMEKAGFYNLGGGLPSEDGV